MDTNIIVPTKIKDVEFVKANMTQIFPGNLTRQEFESLHKNRPYLKVEICCYCGLIIATKPVNNGVLIPHVHFHTESEPMHNHNIIYPTDIRLGDNVMEQGLVLITENTICSHHLWRPKEMWEMTKSRMNDHATNAMNIGGQLRMSKDKKYATNPVSEMVKSSILNLIQYYQETSWRTEDAKKLLQFFGRRIL